MTYPPIIPGFPLQVYPRDGSVVPPATGPLQDCTNGQGGQAAHCPSPIQTATYTAPMVTPIVALLLPNYVCPTMAVGLPQPQPVYHRETRGFPSQNYFVVPPSNQVPFSSPSYFNSPNNQFFPQAEAQSRSSTPQSGGCGGPASPPLFQSRCSSPLNLVELELSLDRQDSTVPREGQGNSMAEWEKSAGATQAKKRDVKQVTQEKRGLALFDFSSPFPHLFPPAST